MSKDLNTRKLNVRWVKWVDWVSLDKVQTYKIVKHYDFHELDVEACMEENQTARIDSYDNYLFIILHFPKYNIKTKIYELNEFNIFLWKDFLITLKDFWWIHIDDIFNRYSKLDMEDSHDLKVTSWYILYEIIQAMLEKMFKVYANIKKDIRILEREVFDNASAKLVQEIMIKKRNIILLKHMFRPQIIVMRNLENHINTLFNWKMEVYFEDLEDKLNNIINNINMLEEHIDSIEDAFKTIIDIRTNSIIKLLTIFSAFILPLTLLTSFYWMNIDLPLQNSPILVYVLFWASTMIMWAITMYLKKNWKF